MTLGAGAEGGVEAEAARLEFGDVEAAVGAGHGGGEELFFAAGDGDEDEAVGELKGLADGLFEAFFDGGLGGRVLTSWVPGPQVRGTGGTRVLRNRA